MAKKKKNNTEGRSFFRFMSVIGVVTIGGLIYAFMNAAPSLSRTEEHLNANIPSDCLNCHMAQIEEAPIMPHRPMQACNSCHRLREKNES